MYHSIWNILGIGIERCTKVSLLQSLQSVFFLQADRDTSMKLHIQSTIFGQLVRLVSCNKIFRYPDEIDPSLWQKAVERDNSQHLQQRTEKIAHVDKQEQEIGGSSEALVITWYGPEDPEVRSFV
jgi:hypothetical protein